MTRFLMFLFLFIIIFLSGMIVGINQHTEQTEILIEEDEIEEIVNEPSLYVNEEGEPNFFTQKLAFFGEKIISTVYDVIVAIMYNIAKVFTG